MSESQAAQSIHRALKESVADLPLDSEVRALALRSANTWATIAEQRATREDALDQIERFTPRAVS